MFVIKKKKIIVKNRFRNRRFEPKPFVEANRGIVGCVWFTAVSTKAVLRECKSVRENADWHYE